MSHNHRNPEAQARDAAFVDVMMPGGGKQPSTESERQMAELGVWRDGCDYAYQAYRYEQLGDALAYARLTGGRSGEENGPAPFLRKPFVAPTDAERALMGPLGIQFDGRAFCFAGYRYDRLADAVKYARRANGPD